MTNEELITIKNKLCSATPEQLSNVGDLIVWLLDQHARKTPKKSQLRLFKDKNVEHIVVHTGATPLEPRIYRKIGPSGERLRTIL